MQSIPLPISDNENLIFQMVIVGFVVMMGWLFRSAKKSGDDV